MKHKKDKKKKKRRSPSTSSSSSSQNSNEWVEKSPPAKSRQFSLTLPENPPQLGPSLGSSFLDLALSSSTSREKKEKAAPASKIQTIELPIGLYYPNKKQETANTNSCYERKTSEKVHQSHSDYNPHKYRSGQSERQSSRQYQKPKSDDDEYDSHRRKDKHAKSERHDSRQYQKPSSDDDEYDSHRRKDKHAKSERHNSRQYQKPSSDDDEYDLHRKGKHAKSERHNSRQYLKPSSDDDEYDSQRKNKHAKSEIHNSRQYQKPSSDDDEYDLHRKDKHAKSEKHNSRQYQKPSSDDDFDSHIRYRRVNNEKCSEKFQKPRSESEDNDSNSGEKCDSNEHRKNHETLSRNDGQSSKCSSNKPIIKGESNSSSKTSAQKLPVLHDDVNKIAAKLIKAEIMGNTELVAKLKASLEAAKSQEIVYKRPGSESKKTNVREENKDRVVVVSEVNMKDRRRTELLERKKLAFLGNNEDRWVSEGKSFPNIGDEYEEEETPKRKKSKTDPSSSSHSNAIQDHKRALEKLNSCIYCLSSAKKHQPILIDQFSEQVYLALPGREPLVPHHCIVVTQDHVASLRATDPSTYSSIKSLCEKLVTIFSRQKKTCVFFETVNNMKWNHCHVHCVPLSREVGDMAPLYFQKAISDLEVDTRHNRTLTKIERNKLCSSIPTDMDYFYVNFDWGKGFAHVIENKLSNTFAEEIIGGMLDLNPSLWRNPAPLNYETQMKHKLDFMNIYRDETY